MPVGVPVPGAVAVTAAVKLTAWPKTEGFADELTNVEVLALFTVCPPERVPVLVAKFALPLYTAVTVVLPTGKVETDALVALPPDKVTALPKFTPLVLNCTVPVGVPEPGGSAVTVAVNVTDCPNTEGLADDVTVVVVVSWFIVCVSVPEVLVLKLVSPL